jgi:hypothetical protein
MLKNYIKDYKLKHGSKNDDMDNTEKFTRKTAKEYQIYLCMC